MFPVHAPQFSKPLGYAGDYEMVDMMFRNPFEGGSLFAQMLNAYALQLPPIIGHRNRIDYLCKILEQETARGVVHDCRTNVFNVGCGTAQEVQRFLTDGELANHADFTLLDFDNETLEHASRILNGLIRKHQRRTQIQTVRQSVFQILKEFGNSGLHQQSRYYNLIYCAGLFDYLSDQICRQLIEAFYAMLSPNGLLIVTNVDKHTAINQMECFLDWHLVYRNKEKMQSLVPPKIDPQTVIIKQDATGVNLFMEIRKPNGE